MIELLHGLRKQTVKELSSAAVVDETLAEHQRLASKHGVATVATRVKAGELAEFLQEENIRVYDLRSVESYLDRKCHGRGLRLRLATWYWRPLRAVDLQFIRGADVAVKPRRSRFQWTDSMGRFDHRVYTEIIPLPVLITVDRITERLGESVSFYVAAIEEIPDPFLGVRLKSDPDEMFVIERWDEPGFRG